MSASREYLCVVTRPEECVPSVIILKPITRKPWHTRGCCALGGDRGRNFTKNVLNANRLASRSVLHLYLNSQC
jgi:hypothetical protein